MIYALTDVPQKLNSQTKSKLTWLSRYMSYDYIAIFKAGGWSEADGYRFTAFLNFMYPELKHAIIFNYPIGHSVGYIAKQLGMRKEDVNHCQHLACLFGMLEKDRLLYSRKKKRPDRFHFKTGVPPQQIVDVLRRLSSAGIKSLKQLTKKNVAEAGFTGLDRIYRRDRRGDKGITFEESYAARRMDQQLLFNIVTSRPEELLPYLPDGIKPQPFTLPSGKQVYRFVGKYVDRYVVAVLPPINPGESYSFKIYPDLDRSLDDYNTFAILHKGKPLDAPGVVFDGLIKDFIECYHGVPQGYSIVPAGNGMYRFHKDLPDAPTSVWQTMLGNYDASHLLDRMYNSILAPCLDYDYFERFVNRPAHVITTKYPELLPAPDGMEWKLRHGRHGCYYQLTPLSPHLKTVPVLTRTYRGRGLMWHFVSKDKVDEFVNRFEKERKKITAA